MVDLERLQAAVEAGDREAAVAVTEAALAEGIAPLDILEPMTEAMGVIGDRFSRQEIFVPEMLISARAMKAAVALLEPLLVGSGRKPDRVAVMGTI
jgi:methanogenic corrinoid protein MtbC1